jgi:hypothetical protein
VEGPGVDGEHVGCRIQIEQAFPILEELAERVLASGPVPTDQPPELGHHVGTAVLDQADEVLVSLRAGRRIPLLVAGVDVGDLGPHPVTLLDLVDDLLVAHRVVRVRLVAVDTPSRTDRQHVLAVVTADSVIYCHTTEDR